VSDAGLQYHEIRRGYMAVTGSAVAICAGATGSIGRNPWLFAPREPEVS
jgi:hypothetical protein